MQTYNGMPATELPPLHWHKGSQNDPRGSRLEMARLPGGDIAVRNSDDPDGPALIYTQAEIDALILGAKDGDFDDIARQSLG